MNYSRSARRTGPRNILFFKLQDFTKFMQASFGQGFYQRSGSLEDGTFQEIFVPSLTVGWTVRAKYPPVARPYDTGLSCHFSIRFNDKNLSTVDANGNLQIRRPLYPLIYASTSQGPTRYPDRYPLYAEYEDVYEQDGAIYKFQRVRRNANGDPIYDANGKPTYFLVTHTGKIRSLGIELFQGHWEGDALYVPETYGEPCYRGQLQNNNIAFRFSVATPATTIVIDRSDDPNQDPDSLPYTMNGPILPLQDREGEYVYVHSDWIEWPIERCWSLDYPGFFSQGPV